MLRSAPAAGPLIARAAIRDTPGRSARAEAAVVVERESIAGRMTNIGRVIVGDCGTGSAAAGLGGIRVMMEDGSLAVTDAQGRYRLEGVVPGTHVVQIARGTLPQDAQLFVDSKPADPAGFDGTLTARDRKFAVTQWRGTPVLNERSILIAEIVSSQGGVNAPLERAVFFTSQPARVELEADQSLLIADGVTRPVVVMRITDRSGRPVREGISGSFTLSAPFESAAQIEQQQLRQLSGIGEASARWQIEGDDGLARIELAPTMVSGQLRMAFDFANENIRRLQEIAA